MGMHISLNLQQQMTQPHVMMFHSAKQVDANRKRCMRVAYFHMLTMHALEVLHERFFERRILFENVQAHKLVDSIGTDIDIERENKIISPSI